MQGLAHTSQHASPRFVKRARGQHNFPGSLGGSSRVPGQSRRSHIKAAAAPPRDTTIHRLIRENGVLLVPGMSSRAHHSSCWSKSLCVTTGDADCTRSCLSLRWMGDGKPYPTTGLQCFPL
eukprot:206402-Pelagomonas_calceolata.AAC.1